MYWRGRQPSRRKSWRRLIEGRESVSSYYTIGLSVISASSAAYYQIDPSVDLSILQGGFVCSPSELGTSSVAIYPQVAQLQFPAARYISGSVTIVTDAPVISGNFIVSPAINSNATLTLYGAGNQQLGTATLSAGQTSLSFSWKVSADKAMSEVEAKNAIAAAMKNE